MSESDKPWSRQVEDNVIVWDIRGWTEPTDEELQAVTEELQSVASRSHITASVTQMEGDVNLDKETLTYIEQNNEMYAELGLTKVAWVSDGIQGLALKSKINDVEGVEVEAFDEVDEAIDWATE